MVEESEKVYRSSTIISDYLAVGFTFKGTHNDEISLHNPRLHISSSRLTSKIIITTRMIFFQGFAIVLCLPLMQYGL